MDTEHLLADQTLVIEDGRIVAMGPSSSIEPEHFYVVVDGTGKYLLPGLADMHVHYWSPGDAALFLAHGVTVVRNMAGRPFHLLFQRNIQQCKLPGPFMVTTSPLLESEKPVHPTWKVVADPNEAAAVVHAWTERGYQQIKVYNLVRPEVLHALGRTTSAIGVRMTGHCPDAMTFEEAIIAGMTCFEHLTGIWRGHLKDGLMQRPNQRNLDLEVLQMTINHLDLDAIRRLAHSMAREQIWNCPTLVAFQWMHETQQYGQADPLIQPLLKYISPLALRLWKRLDPSTYKGAAYPQWIDALHARNQLFSQIVALFHQEGAPLLLGTDTSVRFVIPGFSVHQELANFVDAGLRPFEALRCATSEAARFLEQEDEWGTVTVGKQANLLLLNKNPFADIRSVNDVNAVVINGFFLSRTDLDALLVHQESVAMLQPPHSLPHIAFGIAHDEGTVVSRGTWIERTGGDETGHLTYRHRKFADGSWLIEEQFAFERGDMFSIGGEQCSKTSLHLAADLTVRRATFQQESFLGKERIEVAWTSSGAYIIRRKEIDGHETIRTVTAVLPLLPNERLSVTVWPLLLMRNGNTSRLQVLNSDASESHMLTAIAIAVPSLPEENGKQQWLVQIERPEGTIHQWYYLTTDGQFLRLEEDEREFLPE
jgi:hypothetical protein